ncbi:MAG: signal peptidase I [Candidatus Berkelbacteria bacterium]|nr:signal peptidase I [Candidatus Berkelbacteria bacterium]
MPEDENTKTEQPYNETLSSINSGGENRTSSFFSFLFDLAKTFVVVMLIAFAIRYFVIQPFVVDGDSMMPTFVNNEYLIAEKISYDFTQPSRGDIVIFRYPKNPSIIYIKRIIGLPGETVTIKDGKVYIADSLDATPLQVTESYIDSSIKTNLFDATAPDQQLKLTLKDNEFFALGDNRDHSSDSREWGILPRANIIGRVWLTVTPIDHFKLWSHQNY